MNRSEAEMAEGKKPAAGSPQGERSEATIPSELESIGVAKQKSWVCAKTAQQAIKKI